MLERCRWLCVLWFTLQISMFTQKKNNNQKQRVSVSLYLLSTMQHSTTVTLLFLYSVCCFVVLFTVGVNQHFSVFHRSLVCCSFSGCKCEFNHHSISASARVNSAFVVFGFVFVDVCVSTPFYAMAFNMKFV